jgi:GTP cyclohydrolase II
MPFGSFISTYIPTDSGEFNIFVLPELIKLGSQNGCSVYTILDHYAMVPSDFDNKKNTVIHFHRPDRYRDLFLPAYYNKKGIPELLLSQVDEVKDGVILYSSQLTSDAIDRLREGLDTTCEYTPISFDVIIDRFSTHLNLLPDTPVEFTNDKIAQEIEQLPVGITLHTLHEVVPVKIPTIALEGIFPGRLTDNALFRKHLTHAALVNLPKNPSLTPYLRVHSSCETGDMHNAQTCDCGQQFRLAVSQVSKKGGIVIYDDAEGRGSHWLSIKMLFYRVTATQGLGTYDVMAALGYERNENGYGPDLRTFNGPVLILKSLGISSVTLGTNNHYKVEMLTKAGITVNDRQDVLPEIRNQIQKNTLLINQLKVGTICIVRFLLTRWIFVALPA